MQTQVPGGYPAAAQPPRPPEPNQEKYLRHIRNILGWILALWLIGGLVTGIVIVAQAAHSGSSSSSCVSQGGTDPSC